MSDDLKKNFLEILQGKLISENNPLISWGLVEGNKILSSVLADFIRNEVLVENISSSTKYAMSTSDQFNIQDVWEHELTKLEFLLWQILKSNLDQVVSRETLIKAGWPDDNNEGVSDEALDQAMSRLRRKMEFSRYRIKTIKSRGFLARFA